MNIGRWAKWWMGRSATGRAMRAYSGNGPVSNWWMSQRDRDIKLAKYADQCEGRINENNPHNNTKD